MINWIKKAWYKLNIFYIMYQDSWFMAFLLLFGVIIAAMVAGGLINAFKWLFL